MKLYAFVLCLFCPGLASAQDRDFTLSAPQEIVETGFLQHLLPRFSLKHGVRVTVVADGAVAVLGVEGVPVFAGLDQIWYLTHSGGDGPTKFEDWLASEIGRRTIGAFQPGGSPIFSSDIAMEVATPEVVFGGDPVAGEGLSMNHCGRCHVINDSNRMKGMGQTPSFGLLRTFDDWKNRFSTFYILNPHPSFTQIADITPPFNIRRPPAIYPLELTQEDLEAILAYVATIAPADLGAPLQSQ